MTSSLLNEPWRSPTLNIPLRWALPILSAAFSKIWWTEGSLCWVLWALVNIKPSCTQLPPAGLQTVDGDASLDQSSPYLNRERLWQGYKVKRQLVLFYQCRHSIWICTIMHRAPVQVHNRHGAILKRRSQLYHKLCLMSGVQLCKFLRNLRVWLAVALMPDALPPLEGVQVF